MKVHTSKVSYGLLIFIFLLIFAPMVPVWMNDEVNDKITISFAVMVVLFGFILHLFMRTTYTIDEGILKIRSGFIPYRPIKISEIRKIEKTKSLYSSPAPSFDRIVIKYGTSRSVIVSPKDKVSFAKDLCFINPNITNLVTEN